MFWSGSGSPLVLTLHQESECLVCSAHRPVSLLESGPSQPGKVADIAGRLRMPVVFGTEEERPPELIFQRRISEAEPADLR